MSEGNEAYEKLCREMSAKYDHMIQRIDLDTPGVRFAPTSTPKGAGYV